MPFCNTIFIVQLKKRYQRCLILYKMKKLNNEFTWNLVFPMKYEARRRETTIMPRHIPAWLWLNFLLNMKQKSLLTTVFARFGFLGLFPVSETQISTPENAPWVSWGHKKKFAEGTKGHTGRAPIRSVWIIGLTVGMLVLAQKEPTLKAIIKICIKVHKNVFLTSPDQIWSDGTSAKFYYL